MRRTERSRSENLFHLFIHQTLDIRYGAEVGRRMLLFFLTNLSFINSFDFLTLKDILLKKMIYYNVHIQRMALHNRTVTGIYYESSMQCRLVLNS
jgi:hypothetical protein